METIRYLRVLSKDRSTEQNPLIMMSCGHVVSKESLQKLSKANGCVVVAPCVCFRFRYLIMMHDNLAKGSVHIFLWNQESLMRCAFISDFYIHKVLLVVLCRTVHLCNINMSCFKNRSWISTRLGILREPANMGYSVSFPRWSL